MERNARACLQCLLLAAAAAIAAGSGASSSNGGSSSRDVCAPEDEHCFHRQSPLVLIGSIVSAGRKQVRRCLWGMRAGTGPLRMRSCEAFASAGCGGPCLATHCCAAAAARQCAFLGCKQGVLAAARTFWDIFGPGGKLHPAYFLEHRGHLVVEGCLLLIIGWLFLQAAFKPKPRSEEPLTEKVGRPARAGSPAGARGRGCCPPCTGATCPSPAHCTGLALAAGDHAAVQGLAAGAAGA